jgi:hypothetical protein
MIKTKEQTGTVVSVPIMKEQVCQEKLQLYEV